MADEKTLRIIIKAQTEQAIGQLRILQEQLERTFRGRATTPVQLFDEEVTKRQLALMAQIKKIRAELASQKDTGFFDASTEKRIERSLTKLAALEKEIAKIRERSTAELQQSFEETKAKGNLKGAALAASQYKQAREQIAKVGDAFDEISLKANAVAASEKELLGSIRALMIEQARRVGLSEKEIAIAIKKQDLLKQIAKQEKLNAEVAIAQDQAIRENRRFDLNQARQAFAREIKLRDEATQGDTEAERLEQQKRGLAELEAATARRIQDEQTLNALLDKASLEIENQVNLRGQQLKQQEREQQLAQRRFLLEKEANALRERGFTVTAIPDARRIPQAVFDDPDAERRAQNLRGHIIKATEAFNRQNEAIAASSRQLSLLDVLLRKYGSSASHLRREFVDIGIAVSSIVPGMSRLGFVLGPLISGGAILLGIVTSIASVIASLIEWFKAQYQIEQLSAALNNLGVNVEFVRGQFLNAAEDATRFGFAISDSLAAVNDLIASTGSLEASMRGYSAAVKIAAADQISLQQAVANVNTVLTGSIPLSFNRFVSSVRQMRIELREAVTISRRMEILEKAIEGISKQAQESSLNTFTGQLREFGAEIKNLLIDIGEEIDKALRLTKLMKETVDILQFARGKRPKPDFSEIESDAVKYATMLKKQAEIVPLLEKLSEKQKQNLIKIFSGNNFVVREVNERFARLRLSEAQRNEELNKLVVALIGQTNATREQVENLINTRESLRQKLAQFFKVFNAEIFGSPEKTSAKKLVANTLDENPLQLLQKQTKEVFLKANQEITQFSREIKSKIAAVQKELELVEYDFLQRRILRVAKFAEQELDRLRDTEQAKINLLIPGEEKRVRAEERLQKEINAIQKRAADESLRLQKESLRFLGEKTRRLADDLLNELDRATGERESATLRAARSVALVKSLQEGISLTPEQLNAEALKIYNQELGEAIGKLQQAKNAGAAFRSVLKSINVLAAAEATLTPKQIESYIRLLRDLGGLLAVGEGASEGAQKKVAEIISNYESALVALNEATNEVERAEAVERLRQIGEEARVAAGELQQLNREAERLRNQFSEGLSGLQADVGAGRISAFEAEQQKRELQLKRQAQLESELLLLQNRLAATPVADEAARLPIENAIISARAELQQLNAELDNLDNRAAAGDLSFTESVQAGLSKAGNQAQTWQQVTVSATNEVAERFSQFGADAVVSLGEFIDGTKSASKAFREFAASLLRDIARMIIQMLIFRAIQNSMSGSWFGGSTGTGGAGAGKAHGGIIKKNGTSVDSFSRGGVFAPWQPLRLPRTSDDRYMVWVRGGEGFIRPEAVDWLGGPAAIHAINRLQVPRHVFRSLTRAVPPTGFHFADGGVFNPPAPSAMSGERTPPLVLQNVVAIGDDEINVIGSRSSFKEAVFAAIRERPDAVNNVLRGQRGFGER